MRNYVFDVFTLVTLLQTGGWILYTGFSSAFFGSVFMSVKNEKLKKLAKIILKVALVLIIVGIVCIGIALVLGGGWKAFFVA